MKVTQIGAELTRLTGRPAPEVAPGGGSFGELLSRQLNQIEATQNRADQMTQDLITGQTEDLHAVLVAAEEARITLEMSLQIRNKAIEAYKEITNMQL